VIYSNLHHTGIWPEGSGPYPLTLTFWIKGAVGGEQARFTVAVNFGTTSSTSVRVPIPVTTSWQQIVIPWANFKIAAGAGTPVGIGFSASLTGKTTFFIDQMYACRHVPVATAVENAFARQEQSRSAGPARVIRSGDLRRQNLQSARLFDFTGRQIQASQISKSSDKAYIVDLRPTAR
jgi:hypothetical protein